MAPSTKPKRSGIRVMPFAQMGPAAREIHAGGIDSIFFEASSVRSFADDATRKAFHWLWLGRYLTLEPEHAFLAVTSSAGEASSGRVCGYLVGSIDDPAVRSEFETLAYFQDFKQLTQRFPAHLHINLAPDWRGHGIGACLIAEFETHARALGCPGLHVVTGAGMRNIGFYSRLGFAHVATSNCNGRNVVMLAKALI